MLRRPLPHRPLIGHLRLRRPPAAGPQQTPDKKRAWGGLANLATVLAVLSLAMSLFGYGVLMGLGASFHIDHNTLISSPFDQLLAAWVGIAAIAPKALSFASLLGLYQRYALVGVALVVFAALYVVWVWRFGPEATGQAAFKQVFGPWVRRLLNRPRGEEHLMTRIVVMVLGFSLVVTPIVLWAAAYAALMAVALLPVIGHSAAQDFAQRYVLPATQCLAKNQVQNPTPPGLDCVTTHPSEKTGGEPRAGYIVVATSAYALLYDPATRLAERVPLQNAVIRSHSPTRQVPAPEPAAEGTKAN